jgi:outer membrane protein, adhesin transport system
MASLLLYRGESLIQLFVIFCTLGVLSGEVVAAAGNDRMPLEPVHVMGSPNETSAHLPLAVLSYVRMTLHRHPELLLTEAQSRGAESQAREAQAQRAPKLVLSGMTGFEKQKINAASLTNKYEQVQAQARVTMPLLDHGLKAQIEQRRSASVGADWRLVDKREDLMLRTLETYAEMLRASRLLQLSQANLAMHRDYVQQVKAIAKLDLGRAADLPAAMGRVSLAEAVNTSRLARLEQVRLEFQSLTGLARVQDMPDLVRFAPASTLDDAYQAALKASPALQVAQADIEAARQGVLLAKAPYRPRLSLDASAKSGRDWGGLKGQQSDLYLGLQAEWTVPAGGAYGHAVQAATESEVATRYAYEKARDELQLRVSTAWFDFLAQSQSLDSYTDYVQHAEAMVDASRKQFKIGRRSLLDVLNAENELFTARSNKLSAELDQIKSAWRLVGLQGQLAVVLGL